MCVFPPHCVHVLYLKKVSLETLAAHGFSAHTQRTRPRWPRSRTDPWESAWADAWQHHHEGPSYHQQRVSRRVLQSSLSHEPRPTGQESEKSFVEVGEEEDQDVEKWWVTPIGGAGHLTLLLPVPPPHRRHPAAAAATAATGTLSDGGNGTGNDGGDIHGNSDNKADRQLNNSDTKGDGQLNNSDNKGDGQPAVQDTATRVAQ